MGLVRVLLWDSSSGCGDGEGSALLQLLWVGSSLAS